jgi:hypothetical protein
MSKDKIHVSQVVGPVNIKSRLDQVTQSVMQAPALDEVRRAELARLIGELHAALQAAADQRPDDAERVVKTAELVIAEASKPKPDKAFMTITSEGLKQAAQAVADIAPTVLAVAGKVAGFVAALV